VAFKNANKDGWRGDIGEKESSERQQWDTSSGDNERIRANNEEAWSATASIGIRQQYRKERERSKARSQPDDKQFEGCNKLSGADFEMFPSVPSLCHGDDGLSGRLDSITFPKWRKESIMAGGNAIVPQVVYQIFKAIEQYNELDKQLTI
jgi:DNA (cytosine-5)-methyltransferase 1